MQHAEPGTLPLLDLVIVMDSGPSMKDKAQELSRAVTDAMQATRMHCPADLRLAWFGLEGTRRDTLFTATLRTYLIQVCQTPAEALRSRRRGTVPGGSAQADGARAIEDVARYFDWRPGARRAIFWLGDKALEGGGNLVGDDDVEAANRAIVVAREAGMTVHTYLGTSRSRDWEAMAAEYARVSRETGGHAFTGRQEPQDFVEMFATVVGMSCKPDATASALGVQTEDITRPAVPVQPADPVAETTPEAAQSVPEPSVTSVAVVLGPQKEGDAPPRLEAAPPLPTRPREALELVKNHVIGAMAIGALPLPLIDAAAVTTLQLCMIARLSRLYNVPFSQHTARSLVFSLLGGITPAMARQVGVSLLKFLPVLGPSVGTIVTTTSAGATTYAVGVAFMRHFEHGRSFLTLKREDLKRDVQHFMHQGNAVASALQDNAR